MNNSYNVDIISKKNTCKHQCFTPETLIYGEFGVKRIDEIQQGDKVFTFDRSFKAVSDIFKDCINKEILKISTDYSFDEILITKEHPVYSFNEEDGIPCFINANDLTPLHKLCFSLQKDTYQNNDNMKDYYKFYGIIFANGNIYKEHDIILIIFKEFKNIISFLEDFLIKEKISYILTGYTFNIKLSDIKIEYIKNIYNDNEYKKIDIEFFNISKRDTKEFLNGIFECCDKYFITENRILAYQLSYLSIKADKPRKCEKDNILYKIECKSNDDLYEMYEYDDDVELNSLFENKIWFQIKDIERFDYEGVVYDLNIEENDNYTTNLGIVHNFSK